MKPEHLIVQQLLRKRKVTLQNIGTFYLSTDAAIAADDNKEVVIPKEAIRFEFDRKAGPDEDFIDFIVEKSKKIKPLATSDLESYSILISQFLNIGKPFPIEGLGVLIKTQKGDFDFLPEESLHAPEEIHSPVTFKEKEEDHPHFLTTDEHSPSKSKWGVWGLLLLIAAIGVSVFIYYQNQQADHNLEKVVPNESEAFADTSSDSNMVKVDTQRIMAPVVTPDSVSSKPDSFKVVFRTYSDSAAAGAGLRRFTSFGHRVQLRNSGSSKYELYLSLPMASTDSSNAIDSIRILFGGHPYISVK